MRRRRVGFDSGHGGDDHPGAVVAGSLEAIKNIRVASMVVKKLIGNDSILPIPLAIENTHVSLAALDHLAKSYGCELIVSFHHNASLSPERRGLEVYTWRGNYKTLAIAQRLIDSAPFELTPATHWYSDHRYNGELASPGAYAITRGFDASCVLVECGFLTNEFDLRYIESDNYVDEMSSAIVMGLVDAPQIMRTP